jgi:ribosome biogenesis protein Nip4
VKAHVGRWSEDCPEHSGVIVYSQDDTPLGFGGKIFALSHGFVEVY